MVTASNFCLGMFLSRNVQIDPVLRFFKVKKLIIITYCILVNYHFYLPATPVGSKIKNYNLSENEFMIGQFSFYLLAPINRRQLLECLPFF